jgi:Glycosyl transferase family 2
MALKYAIDQASVTPILTSCGRFDLLEQTVASFLEHFETDRIVIAEDSESPAAADAAAEFATDFPVADMRINRQKLGQMRSIDALYATVHTPYVLHLEDDWRFTAGVDLSGVIDFLETRPDVSVVCVGYRFDKRFAHKVSRTTHAGIEFLLWDLDTHPKWFSYSFNPSVGRVALWRQIGPFARFQTEENVSAFCKARGMRIAMVAPSIAHHLGDHRHAHDPFQPKRAKTLVSRLKRSIVKRLPKAAAAAYR